MAIASTGAIFKTLEFDGESSGNYGVYISGEAVYDAPERDVEMITIPNRNGAFALDNGRFENIEVTYPAGLFADTEQDFAEGISDFRNFLCSKKGYCRLTDEYNPNEYRMAIYKSGLEVSPTQLKAGEFEITFECKPQRYLISGESAVTVASGSTITNPTYFDSQPMLEVYGYGDIYIGSDLISIENTVLGRIKISEDTTLQSRTGSIPLDVSNLYYGDDIYVRSNYTRATVSGSSSSTSIQLMDVTTTATTLIRQFNFKQVTSTSWMFYLDPDENALKFKYGTASTVTTTWAGDITYKSSGNTHTASATWTLAFAYDGDSTVTITSTRTNWPGIAYSISIRMVSYYADSTVGALGHPLYIDLESGEAWNNDSGTAVSSNNGVSMPSKLSVLKPGNNTITYANTVTSFKIIPRWWKI